MKIMNYVLRVCAFIVAAFLVLFGVIAIDVVVIPLALDYPSDYQGGVSFSAMVIAALLICALFKKIVFRESVKALIIALIFYMVCTVMAGVSIVLGYVDIAPVFGWLGIVGLLGYFLIIKPFKKNMIESSDRVDNNAI